jgi:peptidyl-prolyl cis-trans isomerase D
MLDAMRRAAGTWVARILFGLLILSFAIWGIGSDMFHVRGAGDNAAEVGDVAITRDELAQQYRRDIERMQRVLGPEFDSERAREMGLLQRTLDAMIDGRLLGQRARDMGLVASQNLVISHIMSEPAFQGPGRQFDALYYRNALATAGLKEDAYVATLRAGLIRAQLTDALTAGAKVPGMLRGAIYGYRGERRVIEYVRIPNATVGAMAEPTQEDLAAFHAKNAALFTLPEMRELTIISLDPDQVAGEVQPSEAQIKQAYEERLSSLSIPERRRVSQMLFADEAGAKKAQELLAQGKSFEAVAKEAPGQLAQDTSLGLVTVRDLPQPLADAAFALAEGKTSDPVRDPLGWHIVYVEKIEPGSSPTLDAVRPEIVRELARDAAVNSLVKTANKLEDELAGGVSLEQAAQKLGLKTATIGPIDSSGRMRQGTLAAELPPDPKFLEYAFRLPEGQMSQLQESRNGGYFILRVDKVNPPMLRPLDEVRAQVATAWKERQRDDAARQRAEKLLERAKAGEPLAKIAADEKLEAKTSDAVTRFAADPNAAVPAPLISAAFKVNEGETMMAAYDGGYAIGTVKEIRRAAASDASAEVAQLGRELTLAIAQDLTTQYTRALRRVYDVEIHQSAIDSIQ